jgi:6-hydroxytryprostatin B O-methyltransferase
MPLSSSMKDRVSFQTHDFFTPQPTQGDIYLLRHVLHDWPDKYCIQILRHLIASMKDSSRIIINDGIMMEPTETSTEQYWMMRWGFSHFHF